MSSIVAAYVLGCLVIASRREGPGFWAWFFIGWIVVVAALAENHWSLKP